MRKSASPLKNMPLLLPENLRARMLATITGAAPVTGITTQQEFVRTAIARYCQDLEDDYNGGYPYPPACRDDILKVPPTGDERS